VSFLRRAGEHLIGERHAVVDHVCGEGEGVGEHGAGLPQTFARKTQSFLGFSRL
jgi:hypothetical protein